MTAQVADKLPNAHSRIDFGELRMYGLIRQDPSEENCWSGVLGDVFDHARPPRKQTGTYCTACYRGYVASHLLNADGTLTLLGYEYMHPEDAAVQGKVATPIDVEKDPVNERVPGDFWMVLRLRFSDGPTTFVPFRDGHIIEDRRQWIVVP